MHHTSNTSLTGSTGSKEDGVKMGRVLFDYKASALEELTIRRGEKVEIMEDSQNWWNVKNRLGGMGYVPSNMLEIVSTRRKSQSKLFILNSFTLTLP